MPTRCQLVRALDVIMESGVVDRRVASIIHIVDGRARRSHLPQYVDVAGLRRERRLDGVDAHLEPRRLWYGGNSRPSAQ